MRASEYLKWLVMSLKDRICTLDQGLIVDPKPNFNYEEVYQKINLIMRLIELELIIREWRKK